MSVSAIASGRDVIRWSYDDTQVLVSTTRVKIYEPPAGVKKAEVSVQWAEAGIGGAIAYIYYGEGPDGNRSPNYGYFGNGNYLANIPGGNVSTLTVFAGQAFWMVRMAGAYDNAYARVWAKEYWS